MRAIEVKALSGYKINVLFNDGISGIIDLSDFVQKGIFQELKNEAVFKNVYINGEAIAWSDALEIDAENIYAEISSISPSQLIHSPVYYAAD